MSEYHSNYYQQNKERISQRSKEYYQRRKEYFKKKSNDRYHSLTEEEYEHRRAKQKLINHKNAESIRKSRSNWEKDNPTWKIYHNAKRRAKDFNLPFDIKFTDLVVPTHCPVLGIPIFHNKGHSTEQSPSIDRIIPEKGYVKGNVAIISSKANRLKQNATLEELKAIIKYIENNST